MNSFDIQAWSSRQLMSVEQSLMQWVPADAPAGLGEAMRYAVLDGGKRLRPLLVLASMQACAGDQLTAPVRGWYACCMCG